MWKTQSDISYYTVYYCPKCRRQGTWHTINKSLWRCDRCGLVMRYDERKDRMCLL